MIRLPAQVLGQVALRPEPSLVVRDEADHLACSRRLPECRHLRLRHHSASIFSMPRFFIHASISFVASGSVSTSSSFDTTPVSSSSVIASTLIVIGPSSIVVFLISLSFYVLLDPILLALMLPLLLILPLLEVALVVVGVPWWRRQRGCRPGHQGFFFVLPLTISVEGSASLLSSSSRSNLLPSAC